jgi:hypothetical protein
MLEFTLFSSIFDNKTHRYFSFGDFDRFSDMLHKMSRREVIKPRKGSARSKKDAPLISPAVYHEGTTRANRNVIRWGGWAALDVDDYSCTFEESLQVFDGYDFICYSSASSTKEHPRYRVVLSLEQPVESDQIRHFWNALNKEFAGLGDEQAKDLSRMYYVPGQYRNAYNFIFRNRGKTLSASDLMEKHPYEGKKDKNDFFSALPAEMQRAVLQHRHQNLQNTQVHWNTYRDCQFVNPKMVDHYRSIAHIDGTGRYSYIYKIMLNIASNAVSCKYPITPHEIASLIRELDQEHGNRYQSRPLAKEAERAIEYILKNSG